MLNRRFQDSQSGKFSILNCFASNSDTYKTMKNISSQTIVKSYFEILVQGIRIFFKLFRAKDFQKTLSVTWLDHRKAVKRTLDYRGLIVKIPGAMESFRALAQLSIG